MNHKCFQKTLEITSTLFYATDEKSLKKACLGQHVSNFKIINENVVAVMKKPDVITLNKPTPVEFAIFKII